MNFKEFIEYTLIEAKTLVGVKVVCESKRSGYSIWAEDHSNKYNSFGTTIKLVDKIEKYNKNKDVYKFTFLIKMEDTSIIDKQFLTDKVPDIIRDVFKINFISTSFKATKLMEETSLDNVPAGSMEEKVYKKVFSKGNITIGKKMTIPNLKHGIYRITNLISNEMMLIEYSLGPFSRHIKSSLFVKGKGVYKQENAPNEYLKYF